MIRILLIIITPFVAIYAYFPYILGWHNNSFTYSDQQGSVNIDLTSDSCFPDDQALIDNLIRDFREGQKEVGLNLKPLALFTSCSSFNLFANPEDYFPWGVVATQPLSIDSSKILEQRYLNAIIKARLDNPDKNLIVEGLEQYTDSLNDIATDAFLILGYVGESKGFFGDIDIQRDKYKVEYTNEIVVISGEGIGTKDDSSEIFRISLGVTKIKDQVFVLILFGIESTSTQEEDIQQLIELGSTMREANLVAQ